MAIPGEAIPDTAERAGRSKLLVGPLLRYVGEHEATIWAETATPGCLEVRAGGVLGSEMTFEVAGHSYALVTLRGLATGSETSYEVRLDGELVWPDPASPYPRSVIRTLDPSRPLRVLFGSCRAPITVHVRDVMGSGEDILGAYARRLASGMSVTWPDLLLLIGDQVYADETSPETQAYIRRRRDVRRPPHLQVADFEEYTHLYHETWGDPEVRWLLSTVPSAMIFDDHDVIDDWNTSRLWRDEITATTWWHDRIDGGLMSYWIYQHLGNLSPVELDANDLLREIRASQDGADRLRAFATRADREPDGATPVRWSYRRDLGRVRLLVLDSRCGRVLEEGHRQMVSEPEFDWIETQVADGEVDHLLVVTSVPWLLPRALNDLETADEALTSGTRGKLMARVAERVRRSVDLEHWAAFDASFQRLGRLFERLGAVDQRSRPPATICVLSGDVHHSYVSEVAFGRPLATRVYQMTCSPLHNGIPLLMRGVFRISWSHRAERLARAVMRAAKAPLAPFTWTTTAGPYFGNHLGVLVLDGRDATFELYQGERTDDGTVAVPMAETRRDLTKERQRPEAPA